MNDIRVPEGYEPAELLHEQMGLRKHWEIRAKKAEAEVKRLAGSSPEEIVLQHLSRVVVEPGDVLVLRTSVPTLQAYVRIRKAFRETFPNNKLVLLDRDAELSVLKP